MGFDGGGEDVKDWKEVGQIYSAHDDSQAKSTFVSLVLAGHFVWSKVSLKSPVLN